MQTSNNAAETAPINAIIGSNNQNVTFYNTNENLLHEITFLKQENERLKGMIQLALTQIGIKDKIISVLTKRFT